LGLLTAGKYEYKLKLSVHVIRNGNHVNTYDLIKYKTEFSIRFDAIFEFIEADFDLIIKQDENIELKLAILNQLDNSTTENLINLKIKRYNENENKPMVCCRFIDDNGYLEYLDYWIIINKLSGFDKIGLFTHNLDGRLKFDEIVAKYKGFVEIIPNEMSCITNMLNNLTQSNIKFLFHLVSLSECYQINKDKYKYIAVYDFDEVIFPRSPINNLINESYYIQYERSKPLMPYFESFKLGNNRLNIRFQMSIYLKHESMKILFSILEKMFKQNLKTLNINQHEVFERYTRDYHLKEIKFISIETEQDYAYAKHLYEMHKKYIEPFLSENYEKILLSSIPDVYNRFYYCTGYIGEHGFNGGVPEPKTVHFTNQTEFVVPHWSVREKNYTIVPFFQGYVSHFREKYKRPFKNCSIQEILFDFNYFNNYFKPLLLNETF